MMLKSEIDQTYLKECFHFLDTGVLIWKERPRDHFPTERGYKSTNAKHAGKVAGGVRTKEGLMSIRVSGEYYCTHHLIYMYKLGMWPKETVIYLDGDQTNNRWDNLEEATRSEVSSNQKISKNNKSGHKGVRWVEDRQKWRARIVVRGVKVLDRLFIHERDAIAAVAQARIDHGLDPD